MTHTEPSWSAVTGAAGVLRKAGHLELTVSAHLRKHGLKTSEFMLLAALTDKPGVSGRCIDLAADLGISSGGLTKLVDRATRRGFVYRKPNQLDNRSVLVSLTLYGQQRMEAAVPGFAELVGGMVGER